MSGTLTTWNERMPPASSRRSVRRPATGGSRPASGAASYLAIVAFVIAYVIVNAFWPVPYWVAGLYLVASIACFIAYAVDKSAATAGRWRVSETTLLMLGVVGGWPGAIAAQQTLRHKTKKASFRKAFWGTVVVNLIAFVLFATPVFTIFAAWAAAHLA